MMSSSLKIRSYKKASYINIAIMIAYGFNSAVGTNLTVSWYYIHPAISFIDVVVFLNFILLIKQKNGGFFLLTSRFERKQIYLICFISFWLIISTAINVYRFDTYITDLLPEVKLFYYIFLVHVVKRYSDVYGFNVLINGFYLGVMAFFWQSYGESTVNILQGIPIIWNPNVTGAVLAFGVLFAALSICFRENIFLSIIFLLMFASFSMLTWSKGTWLMVSLGVLICIISLFVIQIRVLYKVTMIAVFLLLSGYLCVDNVDHIKYIFERKMASTENIGSVGFRFNMILASINSAIYNPIIGLGYGNFYNVQLYTSDWWVSNMKRNWNAHNSFFQVLAVGGIPAFLALLYSIMLPITAIRKALVWRSNNAISSFLISTLFLIIIIIYGSVQLQLTVQPLFWFFSGISFSIYSKSFK